MQLPQHISIFFLIMARKTFQEGCAGSRLDHGLTVELFGFEVLLGRLRYQPIFRISASEVCTVVFSNKLSDFRIELTENWHLKFLGCQFLFEMLEDQPSSWLLAQQDDQNAEESPAKPV